MNKKSLVIGGLVLVVLLLAGMLIYTTTANTNKINQLQNQVSSEQEAREQEKAQVKERNDLLTLKNMEYRNNWDKYIRVEEDENYEKIWSGGIKNLQVTVNNDTEYSVDEVVVKVYYILANGTPFETREFSLYNIPAKSFKTDPAPASKTNPQVNSVRGAKVMLEILSISAPKFSFCYPYDNGNPKDPYKCK
jgi:hypothetical protein